MKKFLSVLIAVLTVVSCFAFTTSAADKVTSLDLTSVTPIHWVTYATSSTDGKRDYKIGIGYDADDQDEIPVEKYLIFNNETLTCVNYIQLHTSNADRHLNADGKPTGSVTWSIEGTTADTFKVIAGLESPRSHSTNYTNVYIDGQLVYDGKDHEYTMEGGAVEIEVAIPAGAKTLKLEAVSNGEFNSQFVVWNAPTLFNKDGSEFDPPLPPRLITILESDKNHIKFSYSGAREGGNNWVGVYDSTAEITPDSHEEISMFYVYLAPGDGEYDLVFANCGRIGEVNDDYKPGTMMRNTNDTVLGGHLSEYKLIWLGGDSWYETYAEAGIPDAPEEDSTEPPASQPVESTDNGSNTDSKPAESSKPVDSKDDDKKDNGNGWVLPVVIVAAVVIVVAVVVIVAKKKKK